MIWIMDFTSTLLNLRKMIEITVNNLMIWETRPFMKRWRERVGLSFATNRSKVFMKEDIRKNKDKEEKNNKKWINKPDRRKNLKNKFK